MTYVEGASAHTALSLTAPPPQINRNGTSGVLCLLSSGAPKRNKSFTLISPSRPWVFFFLLPIFRDSIWSFIFQKRADSQANTSREKDIHCELYPRPRLKVSCYMHPSVYCFIVFFLTWVSGPWRNRPLRHPEKICYRKHLRCRSQLFGRNPCMAEHCALSSHCG